MMIRFLFALTVFLGYNLILHAQNPNDLWLQQHSAKAVNVQYRSKSPLVLNAVKALKQYWQGKEGANISLKLVKSTAIKAEGYQISGNTISATTDRGLLYGAYAMLRAQISDENVAALVSNPSYENRILNHWDNLDGSVERGYAGKSIFWRGEGDLTVSKADLDRWKKYAEANASIGINGSVLNNVNASAKMLSAPVLQRVKAIAAVLRPYGIKTYLSVNFSSPTMLRDLKTADPLNADVIAWWHKKVAEIYKEIPDFGGFLVKANSEGQPGPQDFGRTHADGANMLADALKPYGGLVMWRAFVYSPSNEDRAKQAYQEFVPLDGKFRDNVIIQVKNGPIDFQPREPFSPLFGAMQHSSVMPEFQVTQEYLGHAYQVAFLAPMWEECLNSDTYQKGEGSTVAKVTDGTLFSQKHSAIAGVANTGLDSNWSGYTLGQANWYAFGRLAWDNQLKSDQIADEWLKLTFKQQAQPDLIQDWNKNFLQPVKNILLESREAVVNYSMPLGLHHIFAAHHHFGPGPWWAPKNARPDWTPPYYHQTDSLGIGFDRTPSGSNATSQYHQPLADVFNSPDTCPEMYLLWFHHLPWTYQTKSGRSLWDELCFRYDKGLQQVRNFQKVWDKTSLYTSAEVYEETQAVLKRQTFDAQVYKDACLLYFQQFSKMPIPHELERPVFDLKALESGDPLDFYPQEK
ncbi:alpha-glucuronidase [Pelobium manganitolerans]|uniref:alpha-glucuronidase n=1 Tax=Pelobium manganitolerans TaxID=1842495 RepID=UPI003FA38D63